ncbi:MAG TPA: 50S ribosomal protein L25/general stress protein Ctc [Jiangellaceae bacterium]|nr:50S ribosomal protein L25/general stress protein Ctc [Jiangellaceae bacterium]
MSDVKIAAELRTEFGKGAARRLRRADKVPAVLYGHGTDPVHLSLPGHDTMLALKNPNALLTLDIDGKKNELALAKHVQRHPLRGVIEHVDLILVRRGEKVVVDVPVHVVGEAVPGTLVNLDHPTISLKAEATHLPEYIEVSVEGLEPGTLIHASDLTLPSGSELDADPEALVVNVTLAPTAEELEAELPPEMLEGAEVPEEAAEAAEAAEGEAAEGAEGAPAEAEGRSEES